MCKLQPMDHKKYHRGRLVLDCSRHNISMPQDLWERLQAQANLEGTSVSGLLRRIALTYLMVPDEPEQEQQHASSAALEG